MLQVAFWRFSTIFIRNILCLIIRILTQYTNGLEDNIGYPIWVPQFGYIFGYLTKTKTRTKNALKYNSKVHRNLSYISSITMAITEGKSNLVPPIRIVKPKWLYLNTILIRRSSRIKIFKILNLLQCIGFREVFFLCSFGIW